MPDDPLQTDSSLALDLSCCFLVFGTAPDFSLIPWSLMTPSRSCAFLSPPPLPLPFFPAVFIFFSQFPVPGPAGTIPYWFSLSIVFCDLFFATYHVDCLAPSCWFCPELNLFPIVSPPPAFFGDAVGLPFSVGSPAKLGGSSTTTSDGPPDHILQ